MILDIVSMLLLAVAFVHGSRRGAIAAIFSLLSIVVGIAVAMKLAVTVAHYLSSKDIHGWWLPLLSFLIVLLGVGLLVRIVAIMIQGATELLWMGWVNKLAGALLYMLVYLTIYSMLLFFLRKVGWIAPQTIEESHTFPLVQRIGPWFVDCLGNVIPWFKNMFKELNGVLDGIFAHATS